MKKDNSELIRIQKNIKKIENKYKKIDEWIIPRDRSSFFLTHDFHPYFAAFPPKLVEDLLVKYSKEGDIFLDPFMGGGSSIVEGFRLKRKTIGIDISPFAKFISRVKTRPLLIDDKKVSKTMKCISEDIFEQDGEDYKNFKYKLPEINNIDKWFIPKSKYDLTIINYHINNLKDKKLRDFLSLALSSIIRKVSNARNSQQHISVKKDKKIPEVYPLFEQKVELMSQQMKEYVRGLGDLEGYQQPRLYSEDIRRMSKFIDKGSVDIVITSPPYGTGSRYTEVNRLQFEWFGFKKPSKDETMETSKNFKEELKKSLVEIYKVLKDKGYCFFVYGDPSTEESLTKVAIEDAENIGFKYEGLISCPIEKKISNHHEKYRRFIPKDFILIFKKDAA